MNAFESEMLTFPTNIQIIFIILSCCTHVLLSDCPRLCECKWRSGKESVICTGANLSSVPINLEAGTQLLDLNYNNLITIAKDEFSDAGLPNLQKIFMSKCRIKNLHEYAFRNLINLVELDLSYNALDAIPSHTFDTIPELRELKLSGNPIKTVVNNAFANVPELVRLELHDCQIGRIERYAFSGLENSLEWLKVDKNNLVNIEAASLTVLEGLHGLELAENPWNCSCKLRSLKEWLIKKNIPFGIPPMCKYPNRLSSKTWDKLDLDEFACIPEILALESKAHGVEGKNVTLTCRIAGIPEPNVRWIVRNKVIANISGSTFSNGKKLYVVHLQKNTSDLTILTADIQDAGVYVCTAENKAGKSEASVTLAVSRKSDSSTLNKRMILTSLTAGALFTLVSCLVALYFCNLRKKHSTVQWVDRNRHREDNYEKIELNRKIVNNFESNTIECNQNRRNGEYRLVPKRDVEQEAKTNISSEEWKKPWVPNKWNPSELPLLDTEDLHIPRRTVSENRDDCSTNSVSTLGTVKFSIEPNQNCSVQYFKRAEAPNRVRTPVHKYEFASLSEEEEDDEDKKYPDLIEGFSSANRESLTAISEGNSMVDVRNLYCTLPKKSINSHKSSKYSSTDSQLPLLPESRYDSNGGDSRTGSTRRLSDPNFGNQRSNSFVNLTHLQPNSTPLLDISELDNRLQYRRKITSPSTSPLPSTLANSYDYHAAQLERFLEEYRTLQKELTKMKETCDSLTKEKLLDNNKNAASSCSATGNTTINSNQALGNTLSNFENELSKYLSDTFNRSAF